MKRKYILSYSRLGKTRIETFTILDTNSKEWEDAHKHGFINIRHNSIYPSDIRHRCSSQHTNFVDIDGEYRGLYKLITGYDLKL